MIYLLFLLTGACALIYEVVWSRQFGLLFGHTAQAAAVVLAAYFGGMTIGYLLAARLAGRLRRPLRGYAAAELLAAGWALLIPLLLTLLQNARFAALLNNDEQLLQIAIRALVSFILMLPATAALGASLPFVVQHLALGTGDPSRRITLAYSLNTLGAFAGVLLASFYLILHIGIEGSLLLAALGATVCAIIAWFLPSAAPDAVAAADELTGTELPGYWYLLAGLSGFGTLALQVLYNRMFSLVFHNSTYSFGSIVAVFLVALSLASWLVSRSRRTDLTVAAAQACLAGSVAILLGIFAFQRITRLGYLGVSVPLLRGVDAVEHSFGGYMLASTLLIVVSIGLPVALIGMQLPWCMRMLREHRRDSGRLIGRLVALNTACAAVGALVASFLMMPLAGLWHSFMLLAMCYCLLGIYLLWRAGQTSAISGIGAVALALCCGLALATNWPVVTRTGEKLFVRESAYGVISVIRSSTDGEDGLYMRQNNHYTLGATQGMDSELRQGNIPLLLHPAPEVVCFLGLATGITAGAALDHPQVQQLTAAELIPEVVEAAQLFSAYNNNIVENPRADIVVNDARHYLYGPGPAFDVIVSDLFVPWHSQTGYLYTVEHYEAARQRLKPGGLFCQWLPLYQLDTREFALIADSMAAAFPCVTLWRGEFHSQDYPLLLIVGSAEAPVLDAAALTMRLALLPRRLGVPDRNLSDVNDLLELYIGDWPRHSAAVLNTDNYPRVEFLAPVSNREGQELGGERLADFYHDVLLGLERKQLRYIPRRAEPMPDFERGIKRQLDGN
jgi:spermidine synthase